MWNANPPITKSVLIENVTQKGGKNTKYITVITFCLGLFYRWIDQLLKQLLNTKKCVKWINNHIQK